MFACIFIDLWSGDGEDKVTQKKLSDVFLGVQFELVHSWTKNAICDQWSKLFSTISLFTNSLWMYLIFGVFFLFSWISWFSMLRRICLDLIGLVYGDGNCCKVINSGENFRTPFSISCILVTCHIRPRDIIDGGQYTLDSAEGIHHAYTPSFSARWNVL